ncbi:Phosphoethanolamine transferase EptC [Tepidimonas sediminis]|uniref:Phosphoethanolamine transferase EptC n=1 Tax=Tepidimonas sediminis TaxID=2588941 RepID=A0A554WNC1_9BURK|nr:phosphoethanolamine transferase [Tepidimonas sediminis]TSE25075.1 Phosphoethanolamine transferase EptC [Tepidimonas sediminis]
MNTAALWAALLLSPNLAYIAVTDERADALIRTLPASLLLLVALFAWTRRPAWILILLSPLYLLLPFEIFYILQFGHPSSPHIFAVVSESSPTEAAEFLGLTTLFICSSIGLTLFFITLKLALQSSPIPPYRYLQWIAIISLAPTLQYTWMEWQWRQLQQPLDPQLTNTQSESLETKRPESYLSATLSDSYPLGVIFRVSDYFSELTLLREAATHIKQWDFQPRRTVEIDAQEIYVLVIGESSNPRHWGINGYYRDTTPKLGATPNLISFRDVISPFSATRLAVPVILTGKQNPNAQRAHAGQASIVTLFKQAGFKTYWISNQAPLGLHDSIIAVHAYEANTTIYTNGTDYKKQGSYDDAIIPPLDRFLQEPDQRKFFVIHLLGSHKAYANRYPESFDQFLPSQKQSPFDERPDTVTNTYDNTILYTDHILSELINKLTDRPDTHSALIYISDHGENIPRGTCTITGHGYTHEDDFRVSAVAWFSDAYKDAYPEIIGHMKSRSDTPLISAGVFHTLADIAHILHPAHDSTSSWASAGFTQRPRWTSATPDFDRATRIEPCKKLKTP